MKRDIVTGLKGLLMLLLLWLLDEEREECEQQWTLVGGMLAREQQWPESGWTLSLPSKASHP